MNLSKYVVSLAFCNAFRLLRVFPNNDPIMGFMLPYAKKEKWWHAFAFPAIAMVLFDIITAKVGLWTFGTAIVYGIIGLIFSYAFSRMKTVGLKEYAMASIIGVLIFDFITGPIMSSWLFEMTFEAALLGQIPFTILHLASATTMTLLIVPVLDPDVAKSLNKNISFVISNARAVFSSLSRGF